MRAIEVKNNGKQSELTVISTKIPEPGKNEILVKHRAAGINRADLLQWRVKYNKPEGESPILGFEMSGVVTETGSAVTKWSKGDEVFGLLHGGGYAEYSIMHEKMAMPKPEKLSFKEAAVVPKTFLAAYEALFLLAKLQPTEKVLIHTAAGEIGTAAIQLAHSTDSEIFVTCGKQNEIEACKKLGADYAINSTEHDFVKRIAHHTGGKGVNVILDFTGGHQNQSALALDGRLIWLEWPSDSKSGSFSLFTVIKKGISITSSNLRYKSLEYKIDLTQKFQDYFLEMLTDGQIRPVIDSVLHWHDVEEAHQRMAQNKNVGKMVLTFDE